MTRPRISHRGSVLMALAVIDIGVGLSFIWPTPETLAGAGVIWRAQFAPLWVWGDLWVVSGTVCLIAAFFRYDGPGFVAAVVMKVMWALLELSGWLVGAVEQGYRPSLIWFGYAYLIYKIAGLAEPGRPKTMISDGPPP